MRPRSVGSAVSIWAATVVVVGVLAFLVSISAYVGSRQAMWTLGMEWAMGSALVFMGFVAVLLVFVLPLAFAASAHGGEDQH